MKNPIISTCSMMLLLLVAGSLPAAAQSSEEVNALKQEIETLKQGQAAIQRELSEIKAILERATGGTRQQQAFQPTDITVADAPFLGQADAPVTLVEFTDYQCPFCKRHANGVMKRLLKDYVETGKVKYVLREFPIASLHPKAAKGSEAALCAADQGQYWEMHDLLFANPRLMALEDLKEHGETLGLDTAAFNACLDEGKHVERIQAGLQEGVKAGVRGTPSFFVGKTDGATPGRIKATKLIRGAQTFEVFKQNIDEVIRQGP